MLLWRAVAAKRTTGTMKTERWSIPMDRSEINGVVTYYAGRHYHKVVDGEDQTIRKFYSAGNTQVAMRANGVLTWILSDHLGSASVTADESGK